MEGKGYRKSMLTKQIKIKLKEVDKSIFVYIRPETYEVIRNMRIVYAQTYKELLDMKVATKSSMLDILRSEGIWTEQHENELTNLSLQLALVESSLEKSKTKDEEKEAIIKLSKLRRSMIDLINIKTEPLAFVAESIAESITQEKYLIESTFYEDGKRYFKDYNDFKTRRYEDNVQKIIDKFYEVLSEPSAKMYLDFPENQWLIKNGLASKDGEILDETIKLEISSPKEEPKPLESEQKIVLEKEVNVDDS